MADEQEHFDEFNDSGDKPDYGQQPDSDSALGVNEQYGQDPELLAGISDADNGTLVDGPEGTPSIGELDGQPDEPYLPEIGRITILGEEWEHEAVTAAGDDVEPGLGIEGIEVSGDLVDNDQRAETGRAEHVEDPGPIHELDDRDDAPEPVLPDAGTLGLGDPGAIDTDGVFASMLGIADLAPAVVEPSASARQDEVEADDVGDNTTEHNETRPDASDRQGHIEMQELHLKSVQEGISWELFSDGVLSRLGVNEHRYGAAENVEGSAQLDRTFTPSLRPFRDGRSGEVHQRLALAAITEVDPDQGIRRFSYINVGSIDHLGILHPLQGVSQEDAQAVHEKAERLLAAKKDGFLPDLDDDLVSIRNPYMGIAEG